jgi:hypothetical protein
MHDDLEANLKNCQGSFTPIQEAHRFWFAPKETVVIESQNMDVVLLKKCELHILTERDFFSGNNSSLQSNTRAKIFANMATDRMYDLPIPAKDLQNFTKIYALFLWSNSNNVPLPLDLGFWIQGFPIQEIETDTTVNSITVHQQKTHSWLKGNYRYECMHIFMIHGGVLLRIAMVRSVLKGELKKIFYLKENILSSKPTANAIMWEFNISEL